MENKLYCVTFFENRTRKIRFANLSLGWANFWLSWANRNEPELEHQIELMADYPEYKPQLINEDLLTL